MSFRNFRKRLLQSDAVQWIGVIPAVAYFQVVMWTGRYDRQPFPISEPYILAMWHGRLVMLPMLRNGAKPLVALISGHRDGQIIAKSASLFGIKTAVGSSSKGGMRAVREMMRLARDGHSLFVTPDGPRGPRMQVNGSGVLDLARLTGLPILPVGVSLGRSRLTRSWDRLMLPGLLSKVAIRFGEPIRVSAGSDSAEISARLSAALTAAQQEADRLVGIAPVEPA